MIIQCGMMNKLKREVKKELERWYYMIGRVKWFNNTTGYGFIEHKENQDVFIHYSNILQDGFKTLDKDQLVEFQLLETGKGLQALNIKKID